MFVCALLLTGGWCATILKYDKRLTIHIYKMEYDKYILKWYCSARKNRHTIAKLINRLKLIALLLDAQSSAIFRAVCTN